MTDSLDWTDVKPEIKPIAVEYLESVKTAFEDNYDVSYVGDSDVAGGVMWDLTITDDDGRMLVVSFNVVDSIEYEGEMYGYNISVDAVYDDGEIVVKHTPHNYTDDVWTTDLDELRSRAKKVPTITPEVLEN